MRLDITGRHVTITAPLRQLIDKRLARLERVLNDAAVSAVITLTKEKYRLLTELAVQPVPTGDATPLDCVREIKRWPLEARMEEIQRQLKQGSTEAVDALLQEKLELRRRLDALARPAA